LFRTLRHGEIVDVIWRFDQARRTLRRESAGQGVDLSPGLVASFSIIPQELGSDEVVRDTPTPAGLSILRFWFLIRVGMEMTPAGSRHPQRMEFTVRCTPNLLNRRLQSIWNVRPD